MSNITLRSSKAKQRPSSIFALSHAEPSRSQLFFRRLRTRPPAPPRHLDRRLTTQLLSGIQRRIPVVSQFPRSRRRESSVQAIHPDLKLSACGLLQSTARNREAGNKPPIG